ncbi:hypothetical protein AUJ77_03070 [Candidatus Nomurabacteria bacterium CG1_02_43_90]|uniref:Uncharacterized protein n=1 Tax=Candidatus Nomurabacteria bacterium CG1_02_43_90 TaxID=1805281 RepID=A0A1J4V3H0_9BACT|nr:MAG: hypothetical protein AUJ77_03070 [Candidatus Nomurabacteria bacterium CG1_02_43_90]
MFPKKLFPKPGFRIGLIVLCILEDQDFEHHLLIQMIQWDPEKGWQYAGFLLSVERGKIIGATSSLSYVPERSLRFIEGIK